MADRRLGRSIAGLVFLAFCGGCATDRPASTWTQLERVAATYPVPAGFELTATERKGELCRQPGCEKPRVVLRMAPTAQETPDELCVALKQSLRDWDGFVLDDHQSADTTGCSIDGQVRDKGVTAFLSLPETAEEALYGTQVIVSVWA